jgi:hypothetical protein
VWPLGVSQGETLRGPSQGSQCHAAEIFRA